MDEGMPLSQAMGSRATASDGVPLSQMMGEQKDPGMKLSQVSGTPFVSVPGFGQASAPLNLSDPSTVMTDFTPTESAALDMTLGQAAHAIGSAAEIGTAPLQPLALPLRAVVGLSTRAANLVVPGASDKLIGKLPDQPKISDYINQVVPNLIHLDVADFLIGSHLGSPQDYVDKKQKEGMDPATAYSQYQWIKQGAQGLGIAADFVLDPLRFASFGQLNEVAQAARKEGKFMSAEDVIAEHASRGIQLDPLKLEDRTKIIEGIGQYATSDRNLIDVRIPFTDKTVSVPLPENPLPQKVQSAVSKVTDPVQSTGGKFIDALDYRFGVPELDHAAVENYFDKTSAMESIKGNFLKEMAKQDFNSNEQKAIARLVENTPNLLPENIPATGKAIGSKTVEETKYSTRELYLPGSKVVDDQGKPLTVYHGTGVNGGGQLDPKFLSESGYVGPGFYFTKDPNIASKYAAKGQGIFGNVQASLQAIGENQRNKITQFLEKEGLQDTTLYKRLKYPQQDDHYMWKLSGDDGLQSLRAEFDHLYNREGYRLKKGDPGFEKRLAKVLNTIPYDSRRDVNNIGLNAGNVIPVHLNIKNPLDVDQVLTQDVADKLKATWAESNPYNNHNRKALDGFLDNSVGKQNVRDSLRKVLGYDREDLPYSQNLNSDFTQAIQKAGYDGITHEGGVQGGKKHQVWVAFDNKQVISKFDPDKLVTTKVERQVPTVVKKNLGRGLGIYNEDTLSKHMARKLPELSKELGSVTPERADQMINAAMQIKKANMDINGMQYASGLIHDDNLADTIMKRYYAHVPTPEGVQAAKLAARGKMGTADAIRVEENAVSKQLNQALGPSKLSSFNNNRLVRSVQLPIEEAEAVMSKRYGVNNFYVENPFIATGVRWAQSEKAVADKKFLDKLVKYGITPASTDQRLALEGRGWSSLNIPEFKGKTITMTLDGVPTPMKLQDHLFPPNIVSKVGYWMKPGEIGNFEAFNRSYNKVFKTMALLTPGFHVRNTVEDMFKYYANGGTMKGFTTGAVTTLLPILPKSVAAQTVELAGTKYTYGQLAEKVRGLKGSSDSQLNLAEHLFAGKTLFEKMKDMANPIQMAKNVVRTFNEIGEGGIHFMRNSSYLDMVDRGWSHEASLFQTQHLMFDFRRATPTIDKLRSFWDPFIQHAIKTAFITPELMGKAPQAYNQLLNNMPKYLSWAMSDPVKDQYLQMLAPDYLKFRDPVAAPLLPGDSLMAALFSPPKEGKWATFVTPELGPGILKKFQVWDSQIIKNRMGFGPAINSLVTFFTGIGQDGKSVDLDPNKPELMSRAARSFLDAAGAAAFGTPGVWRAIKDQAGVGTPNVLPSTNMRLAQSMFGQFLHFENVQKDYMIKSMAFAGAYGDLQKQLPGALAKESQGRDFSVSLANYPKMVQDLYAKAYPNSANSIWQRYVDTQSDFLKARAGMAGLEGQKNASQILSEMKTIKQTVDRLNEVHEKMTRAVLENASKARAVKTSTQ